MLPEQMVIEESFDASLIQDHRVYESLGLEAQIFICLEETYEWRTPALYLHKTFFVWHALFKSEELCNTQHSKHNNINSNL